MKHKNYCVVCDGGKRSGLTYGSFVVYDLSGKQIAHRAMIFGFGTSLEAEFIAMLNSLEYCLDKGYTRVIFKTDSAELIKHVTLKSNTRKSQLRTLGNTIRRKLKRLEYYQLIKVPRNEIKKVLGH